MLISLNLNYPENSIDQNSRSPDHSQSLEFYCKMTPFLSCLKEMTIFKEIKVCCLLIISQNFKYAAKQILHSLFDLLSERTSKELV